MIFPGIDETARDPRPTALYVATAEASIANSWTIINGWTAPLVYSDIDEEYHALLTDAALVDFGPLCRYIIRGPMASNFLSRITTAPLDYIDIGESARGLIVSAGGGVVDMVDVSRLGEEMYLLTTSRPHARRLQLANRGVDATVEDITGSIAALAIIGPKARESAAKAGLAIGGEDLAAQLTVRGVETSARPIHYGAQSGIEILYPYDEALTVWERVRRASKIGPAGVAALDALRIESGSPQPGADFVSADDAAEPAQVRSPEALGLAHLAPVNRAWFNGRRALSVSRKPESRVLHVLALDAEHIQAGAPVVRGGSVVGRVTSAAFSPRLKRAIAFADLDAGALGKPLRVEAKDGALHAATLFATPEQALAAAFKKSLENSTDLAS
ncbi:MAG: glycine cleavage T C-terminal barrel domain-containing protein [Pseudomonadota bacterium]